MGITNHRLTNLRIGLGMKQYEIAQQLGVGASFYSQVESGDKCPSLETALRIARFFNVPVEFIFSQIVTNSHEVETIGTGGAACEPA